MMELVYGRFVRFIELSMCMNLCMHLFQGSDKAWLESVNMLSRHESTSRGSRILLISSTKIWIQHRQYEYCVGQLHQ
jgi:hypothetical protein